MEGAKGERISSRFHVECGARSGAGCVLGGEGGGEQNALGSGWGWVRELA